MSPNTMEQQQALEAVAVLDGHASTGAVSEKLGTSVEEALSLCIDLVKADYVAFKPNRGFCVTPKGKQAVDGNGDVLAPARDATAQPVSFREGEPWKVMDRGVRRSAQPRSFAKPGQEPDLWNAVKVAGSGRSGPKGTVKKWTSGPAELLHESHLLCSFCKGKGERPAGTKCPVCRGTGAITLKPPVVVCGFCKGRGSKEARNYVTCLVCRGRGYVEVDEGAITCATCRGRGKEPGTSLYCKACKGKGVVSPPRSDAGGAGPRTRVSPTATELQVLKAYCEAEDAGQAPNIPHRTHLTDGYVEMLRKKLCDKGLLVRVGARRYHTTDLGREMVALAKAKGRRIRGS